METMSIVGCIADSTTVDTASANATAAYPIQSHGGRNITCLTIYSNGARLKHIDPIVDPTDVAGTPIQPLVPPVPPVPPLTVMGPLFVNVS